MASFLKRNIIAFLVLGLIYTMGASAVTPTPTPTPTPNPCELTDKQLSAVMGIITNFILSDDSSPDPSPSKQELAIEKISKYADSSNDTPTVQDYIDAGVTGVTSANLSDVNQAVKDTSGGNVDSVVEIQALVNGIINIDSIAPILTLKGDSNITITKGDIYLELGAFAEDNVDGNITNLIKITGEVNTNTIGNYTITYSITDNAGNTSIGYRYITVADITILGDLVLSSDFAYVNTSKDFVARIALDSNITKVELININKVIELKDDGNVSNGDDILGDGVFSGKFNITETIEKSFEYKAKINDKYHSTKQIVDVIKIFTDEDITEAKDVISTALNLLPKDTNLTTDILSKKINDIIKFLKDNDKVLKVESPEKYFIKYTMKSGYIGSILFTTTNKLTGDSIKGLGRNIKINKYEKYKNPLYKLNIESSNIILKKSKGAIPQDVVSTIGSKEVLILDPFEFDLGEYWAYDTIRNNDNFSNKITYLKNYNVTIEKFKNLNQYGIIIISTHSNNTGIILLSQEATKDIKKKYTLDNKKGRLDYTNHITLIEDGGFLYFDSEKEAEVIYLTSSFISYYNKNLPDSLVYLGMCQGVMSGNPLPNIFIKTGAKSVVGYNDTVNSSYDNKIISTFFSTMLDNENLQDSLNEAKKQHGNNDGLPTPAEPVFVGDGNLKLFNEGIKNGSFEENLKFWKSVGDSRVVSKLVSLKPQDGGIMSIISTGLGANNDTNSYVEQTFTVPSNITKLVYKYNIISEEPEEYIGSSYDDTFEVHIIDKNNNDNIVTTESVNTSTWYAIDGINFAGGDDTAYHTKWKEVEIDISAHQGQAITIKFVIYDNGDSAYDTAALLDDIKLK